MLTCDISNDKLFNSVDLYTLLFRMLHITPRYLDYEFFYKENFDVIGILERWDLIKFLTIKKKVYPKLVKDITMVINQGLFYQFTGLTTDGAELLGKGSAPKDWEDECNYEIAASQLLKEGTRIKKKLIVGAFELENHLLHYTLVRSFNP